MGGGTTFFAPPGYRVFTTRTSHSAPRCQYRLQASFFRRKTLRVFFRCSIAHHIPLRIHTAKIKQQRSLTRQTNRGATTPATPSHCPTSGTPCRSQGEVIKIAIYSKRSFSSRRVTQPFRSCHRRLLGTSARPLFLQWSFANTDSECIARFREQNNRDSSVGSSFLQWRQSLPPSQLETRFWEQTTRLSVGSLFLQLDMR